LMMQGSMAASGYMSAEGIVIHHLASRFSFKATSENDAAPKGLVLDGLFSRPGRVFSVDGSPAPVDPRHDGAL